MQPRNKPSGPCSGHGMPYAVCLRVTQGWAKVCPQAGRRLGKEEAHSSARSDGGQAGGAVHRSLPRTGFLPLFFY